MASETPDIKPRSRDVTDGLERAAAVLARAFEDYFVRIPFTLEVLLNAARVDSVDLASSRIFLRDGAAVGGALIARRGWTSRLAGMAIVPEARRGGVGRAAVLHLLVEAKARGDRTMVCHGPHRFACRDGPRPAAAWTLRRTPHG